MPKVPDLLMSQSDSMAGSLGSEGQTSFGADRQLFADKPILSLVEQRVKAVAEATRQRIGFRNE